MLNPSNSKALIFLSAAILIQLFAPGAPAGFTYKNAPAFYRVPSNNFSPVIRKDDIVRVSRLAYSVRLPLFEQPVYHTLPQRYDLVLFDDSTGQATLGVTIGFPGEEIEVVDGLIVANGIPIMEGSYTDLVLTGDCALTLVDQYSILVATVYLGKISRVHQVPLNDLKGKVEPFL